MAYHQSNDFNSQQSDWNQGWDGYDLSHIDQQQPYEHQQPYVVDGGGGGMSFDDPQFGSFDYSGNQQPAPSGYDYSAPFQPLDPAPPTSSAAPVDLGTDYGSAFMAPPPPLSQPYTGAIFQPQPHMQRQPSLGPHSSFNDASGRGGSGVGAGGGDYGEYDDEPPLLEELGINFDHIVQKTWSVLHLLKETDPQVVGDADMAGPLVFCFAFMASLLLGGKVAFGYIYGLGLIGCLGMYLLLNLMSMSGVGLACVVSILGYCLLPMVFLSFASILFSLKGVGGMVGSGVAIGWCGLAAAKLFVGALGMHHQQLIVMYPCCLVYGVFALLTVF